MIRLLILLLGAFRSQRLSPPEPAWAGPGGFRRNGPDLQYDGPDLQYEGAGDGFHPTEVLPPRPAPSAWSAPPRGEQGAGEAWGTPAGPRRPAGPPPRRRWIPRWVKWSAAALVVGLIFRRAIISVVLMALSASLHGLGINVHLPHVRFAWPWQIISAGTTSDAQIGPWVLQKIEGISKPALGTENFTFMFTHKVSKNIGPWPCWYSSTFYAVGHASATVNLNPGPAWWTAAGHYRLQMLGRPGPGRPGQVAVSMVLPPPQLPQSAQDLTIDNTLSKPLDTEHSWTYPGLGCGALIRPQFAESVLYSQAQSIAFYRVNHVSEVTRPLISAAEAEAAQLIRNNFIQPTVNAFGYTLDSFTLHWAAAP
jgi:hypothetical protein